MKNQKLRRPKLRLTYLVAFTVFMTAVAGLAGPKLVTVLDIGGPILRGEVSFSECMQYLLGLTAWIALTAFGALASYDMHTSANS